MTDGTQSSIITNPIRTNLEGLNLKQYYGNYRDFTVDPDFFYLGIGEVGAIPFSTDFQQIMAEFATTPEIYVRAPRYSGIHGERETNELVSAHVNHLIGREVFTEAHVVSVDGAHNGVEVIVRVCTVPLGLASDRRQYVLLPTPSYPYFSSIINAHAGIITFPAYTGEDVVQGIEAHMNSRVGVILLTIPHNPVGYNLTAAQVLRINHIAQRYNCAIAVDIVYAMSVEDPAAVQVVGQFDLDRTIFIDSCSKKFGLPGLRLGFTLTTNPETVEALRMLKAAESITASNMKLLLVGHIFKKYPQRATELARELKRRYDAVYAAADALAPYGVQVPAKSGRNNTFYIPLFIQEFCEATGVSVDAFVELCRDRYQLIVGNGNRYFPPAFLQRGRLAVEGEGAVSGEPAIAEPGVVICSPQFQERLRPMIRLSLGVEHRIDRAIERLVQAFRETHAQCSTRLTRPQAAAALPSPGGRR
ncbi:MAG: pyridoxal phosphate-dependent aminotransferase [Nitrospinae bacterium]|nr:pyridoxal phosphate-dependent aminotransferase [Nitrospinota bacterium]